MKQQYAYFSELPVGAHFVRNGNRVQKVSTRTGCLLDHGRVFYFGKRELCIVGEHSRLAADYFDIPKES